MAHWKNCSSCDGDGVVDCEPCAGTGSDLGDEDAILEGVDTGLGSCEACLGDGEIPCDACQGEGGEWHE